MKKDTAYFSTHLSVYKSVVLPTATLPSLWEKKLAAHALHLAAARNCVTHNVRYATPFNFVSYKAMNSSLSTLTAKLFLPILRGVGQIMLQRHALTGILFLCGLAVNSVSTALAALLGSAVATIMAYVGKFPAHEIEDGLYGFNGALVAIAAVFFYSFTIGGLFAGGGGIVVATLLMRVMQKHSLMPLTFPFIATVWGTQALMPELQLVPSPGMMTGAAAVDGFFQAFGQIMFQDNSLTGLIFLGALLVSSRKAALSATLGAALAVFVALILRWPANQMATGIFGYNAILAAVAIPLISQQILLPVIGVFLSIAITKVMLVNDLSALTFPFVLSVWIVALYNSYRRKATTGAS